MFNSFGVKYISMVHVYREVYEFRSANILQIADVVELSSCCSCYAFRP